MSGYWFNPLSNSPHPWNLENIKRARLLCVFVLLSPEIIKMKTKITLRMTRRTIIIPFLTINIYGLYKRVVLLLLDWIHLSFKSLMRGIDCCNYFKLLVFLISKRVFSKEQNRDLLQWWNEFWKTPTW